MRTTLLHFALLTSISLFVPEIFAQNETQKWYFGANAGLDFSTSPPTVLTNGMLNTSEGCASMSNSAGSLLLYTDGMTIYNSAHAVMANGSGLKGHTSTTQSGVIVKQPGNANIYFVFTLDATGGANGLHYSTVDMNLSAGMGSVTAKNVPLYTPSTERMTAVRHCNGIDTWVVTHEYGTDVFRSYLVSSAGISASPVLSAAGPSMTIPFSTAGQMKISPNGRKLGLVITNFNVSVGTAHVFDFDASSGTVSNNVTLTGAVDMYGCEFSPDGTRFYAGDLGPTGVSVLRQWNLCAGNTNAVISSLDTIKVENGLQMAGFQLAPDHKIYIALVGTQQLAIINNPNALGTACGYSSMGISTAPKTVNLGLPDFVSSYFKPQPLPFTFTVQCATVTFSAATVSNPQPMCTASNYSLNGVKWLFGDAASGSANSSTLTKPSHQFSGLGTFTVKCIYNYQCGSDTIIQPVTIVNKCTGIHDLSENGSVNVYPNPFSDQLQIETAAEIKLSIYNLAGELVLEKQFNAGTVTIDTSFLQAGVYTLKYSGSMFSVSKLLVKTE